MRRAALRGSAWRAGIRLPVAARGGDRTIIAARAEVSGLTLLPIIWRAQIRLLRWDGSRHIEGGHARVYRLGHSQIADEPLITLATVRRILMRRTLRRERPQLPR